MSRSSSISPLTNLQMFMNFKVSEGTFISCIMICLMKAFEFLLDIFYILPYIINILGGVVVFLIIIVKAH